MMTRQVADPSVGNGCARDFGRARAIHREGMAGRAEQATIRRHLQRLSRHQPGSRRLHAEGWLTVVRMMQNMEAPVPADEWGAMTDYLMKNFPERKRPEAVIVNGPAKVNFKMWDVPTQGSRPHDPLAARDGSIWWSGQLVNKLGRVDPKTGAIREYTLKSAFTADRMDWSTTRMATSGLPEIIPG